MRCLVCALFGEEGKRVTDAWGRVSARVGLEGDYFAQEVGGGEEGGRGGDLESRRDERRSSIGIDVKGYVGEGVGRGRSVAKETDFVCQGEGGFGRRSLAAEVVRFVEVGSTAGFENRAKDGLVHGLQEVSADVSGDWAVVVVVSTVDVSNKITRAEPSGWGRSSWRSVGGRTRDVGAKVDIREQHSMG